MVNYKFIINKSNLKLLLHSEKNEILGVAEAYIHEKDNILELKRLGARHQVGTLAYKALAAFCTNNKLGLISNRNNDEFGWRARKHWDAFFKGHYKSEKNMLPSKFLIETDDKSRNYSYKLNLSKNVKSLFEEDYFNFQDFSSTIQHADMTDDIKELLSHGDVVLNYLYERKGNKTLYEKFPISETNAVTGENINSLWDMREVSSEYTCGRCMYLAIALNELSGYEIQMHVDKYKDDMVIEHAWVEISHDKNFDITGYISKEDEWTGGGTTLKNVTRDDIYELMRTSDIYDCISKEDFNKNIILAKSVLENYIFIFFPELNISNKPMLKNSNKLKML